MTRTVTVEYAGLSGNTITSTIVGPDPTITLINSGITSITYSNSVIATLLTEAPLYSTLAIFASGQSSSPINTISSITGSQLEILQSFTTVPVVQIPPQTSSHSSPTSSPTSTGSAARVSPTTTPTGKLGSSSETGPIVGAAIGCLIGGALIAGLLVWLIMSSRHKKQRSHGGDFAQRRQDFSDENREKPLPTVSVVGGALADNAPGWEQHLPQSESDGTIRASVKALFDQIELHVENFYRNASISITPGIQAGLAKVDSNHLPDSVVGLLPQTKTPTMLIKHCLAQLLVSHISADGDTSASFLPADFVALPRAMGGSRTNANKPAFAQALSRWRVLASYLRPHPKDDRAYLSLRDTAIAAAAEAFSAAFSPWAMNPNASEARRQHLVDLMKAATDTGILIFAQPSTFAYRWTVPSEREQHRKGLVRIVVLPGFAKVADEHAKELGARAQELAAPVVGSL